MGAQSQCLLESLWLDLEADTPVVCVAWEDAVSFCNWLSGVEGRSKCYRLHDRETRIWLCDFTATGYRLPTEAEWEHAARAGAPRCCPMPAAPWSTMPGSATTRAAGRIRWRPGTPTLADYSMFGETSGSGAGTRNGRTKTWASLKTRKAPPPAANVSFAAAAGTMNRSYPDRSTQGIPAGLLLHGGRIPHCANGRRA